MMRPRKLGFDTKYLPKVLDEVRKDLKEVKGNQEIHTRRLEALAGDTEHYKREIDEIKRHLDLPLLKYLKETGKEVLILARGPRTAKEIRQFAGSNFKDFEYLREILKMEDKKA